MPARWRANLSEERERGSRSAARCCRASLGHLDPQAALNGGGASEISLLVQVLPGWHYKGRVDSDQVLRRELVLEVGVIDGRTDHAGYAENCVHHHHREQKLPCSCIDLTAHHP